MGASNEPICDSNNDGAITDPATGDWGYIEFGSDSDVSSVIRRAVLSYAGKEYFPYSDYWRGAIRLINIAPILENITFETNYRNAVEIVSGDWTTSSWNNTTVIYWLGDDVNLIHGNTLTMAPGMKIKAGNTTSLFVHGKLIADGTQALPITFTSLRDDTVCGMGASNEPICDSNNDGAITDPATGDWGYIEFGSDSDASSVIRRAVLSYAGKEYFPYSDYWRGAIRLDNASPTISYVLFRSNHHGLDLASGARPTLTCNDFEANQDYGIYNEQPSIMITAEGQWWNSISGPRHATNPSGNGDRVSDGVDFIPWATTPCTYIPV